MGKTPFLGTAYTARSRNLAGQRCINLYLESVETKSGSAPGALFGCPGLDLALTIGTGPVRAAYSGASMMYFVSGNTVYQVSGSLGATNLGTIGTTMGAAYIVSNATQVGVFDSTGLWVSTSGGPLAKVTLPFNGTVGVPAFLDTFCLVNQVGTNLIWQCASNDLTTWPALNFTTEDGNAEPVVGLAAMHDQIVVFKAFSTCFYVNQGNNGFVFGRLPGIYPNIGCAAAASIIVLANQVFWLGQTAKTMGRVYWMDAYEPRNISTYAIENSIISYSTYLDAFAFGYGQGGHSFYVISFPTGGETWVYDHRETLMLKVPVWHQRASFAAGQFGLYAGRCATQFGGTIYMGDRASGNVYALNLGSFTDYNATRKWLRSWRSAAGPAAYAPERVNWLDIQCQSGIGIASGSNPQVVLRQSFDEGWTWSNELYAAVGQTGQTSQSVHFTRLGSTRRGVNSERVFELSSTDVFPAAFMGAEIG